MAHTAIVFSSIEAIEAHQFVGNFHSDSPASDAIGRFILAQTDLDVVRRALRTISVNMMGMEFDPMSDTDLLSEIEQLRDYMKVCS